MGTKNLTWEWDLTDKELDFLKMGTVVHVREKDEKGKPTDRRFFYMPYWFEELDNGYFKAHSLDNMPQELVETIHRLREIDP
jgi:hypothetical protein